MKARRAGTRVIEAAVNTAVAWSTAARVAVARFDSASAAVKTRRGPTGIEELAGVAEVRVGADTEELVRRHVDARSTILTVGPGASTGCLASFAVVPFGAYAPVSKR